MSDNQTNYPILLIITSKQCGACESMRGTDGKPLKTQGKIMPLLGKNQGWNLDFFKDALSGNKKDGIQRLKIYELNLPLLSTKNLEETLSISEFSIVKDHKKSIILIRKTFTKSKNDEVNVNIEHDSYEKKTEILNVKFNVFVKTIIPEKIMKNYLYSYPSFLFIDSQIWYDSLKYNNNLFAYVNGYEVIKNNENEYEIKRGSQQTYIPILDIVDEIMKNKSFLLPKIQEKEKEIINVNNGCTHLNFRIIPYYG